jgi:hypothetical protein
VNAHTITRVRQRPRVPFLTPFYVLTLARAWRREVRAVTMQATMPGPHGPVTAYKRTARQVRAGDWLPDYGAHALTDAVEDPDGGVWLTLDDGRDVHVHVRKVWLFRRYQLAGWQRDAVAAYRDARDARNALRESGTIVPAGVVAGHRQAPISPVTSCQMRSLRPHIRHHD